MEDIIKTIMIIDQIRIETPVLSGTDDIGMGTTLMDISYPKDTNITLQNNQTTMTITEY